MTGAILSTHLPHLPPPRRGKVREVYDLGDELLMVATDRISAFDVVMPNGIPDKGKVLNQLSAFWFKQLAAECPNHVISTDDHEIVSRVGGDPDQLVGRSMIVRRTEPILVECVARGYLAGSWWKDYRDGSRNLHGIILPDGLVENSKLPEPIFTPATKADSGHDENVGFDHVANVLGSELANQLRNWTLNLFSKASEFAATRGLILADTKFEFGMTPDGPIWIDEALTPDSSRYWPADGYVPGHPQPSFDKQFVRDWLETQDWNKQPPGPILPDDVVAKTRDKYFEAFRRITGRDLAL